MKKKSKSAKGTSLATVRQIWRNYNVVVFKGELAEPVFRITRDKRNYGKFVWRTSDAGVRAAIFISGVLNRGDRRILRDTILHEMVHQWQHEHGLRHNEHDETFTQWLPKIKEATGIELQNTWDDGPS